MVHLQEDGYIHRYGIVRCTCISVSSLVVRRVCNKTPYTDACTTQYTILFYLHGCYESHASTFFITGEIPVSSFIVGSMSTGKFCTSRFELRTVQPIS
jgi:hypothetical protein